MLASIIFYILLGLTMSLIGHQDYLFSKKKTYCLNFYSMSLLLIFTLFAGMRYRVGVDCENYVQLYNQIPYTGEFPFEYLFSKISVILSDFGGNRFCFLGFWAFVQIFCLYYALRRRKYLFTFLGWVLILGPFFIVWMNGIRQIVSSLIFFLAITELVDNSKKFRYFVLILLASLIHKSSIILLVFLIFDFSKLNLLKHRYLLISLLILSAILGQKGWINNYLLSLSPTVSLLGYENYSDSIESFIENGTVSAYGPRRISLLILSILSIWFAPKIYHKYKDRFFILSFNFFLIYSIFYDNLFSNSSHIFKRPFYFFSTFELVIFTYLLVYLYDSRKSKYFPLFLLSLILSGSYLILQCLADGNLPQEHTLYKLYFNQTI